jgi:hypothetical protein
MLWETFKMAVNPTITFRPESSLRDLFEEDINRTNANKTGVFEALMLKWLEMPQEERLKLSARLYDWKQENGLNGAPESEDAPSAGKIAPASSYGKTGNRMAARKPHDRGTTG